MLLSAWRNVWSFSRLDPSWREVVFYAEGASEWIYFSSLIGELLKEGGRKISYLTSEAQDPVLRNSSAQFKALYVGNGMARTWLFLSLRAKVMVMTMPDLETFHIKRSKFQPVHYVYVFHTLVSSHAKYRKGALDHYDSIFCAGEHHVAEIEASEKKYDLRKKNLFRHGYGKLDQIFKTPDLVNRISMNGQKTILVAPTWGQFSLLESCGMDLIQLLLKEDFHVILRPHPLTLREDSRKFFSTPDFEVDRNPLSLDSMARSHVMISECSGAALEFAFGFERPVVFLDLPIKVRNPDYREIGCPLLEEIIRPQLGKIIALQDLPGIGSLIHELWKERDQYIQQIRQARSKWVFHLGRSGEVGAKEMLRIVSHE